ncbi:MAG TPA: hypothetical protein VF797_16860 [Noviherbaspirillum sp.]
MGKTHLHQGRRLAGRRGVNKGNLVIAAILANFGGSCRRENGWLVAIGLGKEIASGQVASGAVEVGDHAW